MDPRSFTLPDRIIGQINNAIKVLAAPPRAERPRPDAGDGEPELKRAERLESRRLMRVNHSGEIAAQALYRGQAITARDPAVVEAMRSAAAEEGDHLAWCEQRLRELGGAPSLLNPLWYAGSLAIGAVAGAFGDRTSLGFISETERQVESHLDDHLARLPEADRRSRAILAQMQHDEIRHGRTADSLGGTALPGAIRLAMRLTSRVMTKGSYLV